MGIDSLAMPVLSEPRFSAYGCKLALGQPVTLVRLASIQLGARSGYPEAMRHRLRSLANWFIAR
jgi:hypothetical protein